MQGLTPRQQQILGLIRQSLEATGMPPTRSEIAKTLGFRSVNAAEGHLKALARKGLIELVPGVSRGIRLRDGAGLPVVGRVAAGAPMLAEQHIEDHYRLDPRLFRPRADYLLRVRGMSMREAGILDGDLLAVHRSAEGRNGQIVVARVDNEVTVKRLQRRSKQRIALVPENPEFEPIEIDLGRRELVLEGVGVGVIRRGKVL